MATTLQAPTTGTTTQNQEASLTIAQSLSHILADTYLLYLKTQNFHWNVQGNLFYGIHNLLEEQYQALAIAVDDIAERIRVLGLSAPGSFHQFLELSSLKEASGLASAEEMIAELSNDHITLTEKLKGVLQQAEQNHDVSTVELLSGRIRDHEKQAWMLSSIVR
ncbi:MULTISPECIES: Dps family protein [Cyanophyceae]|uniref:Dps family protein n=1 Tax=Cyanophyceae TaxID=3028117 RepID=UPI00016DC503|nr:MULTISPECIES: DNA starvation/stationary phase protection protein [Cyanophyceae]ACA98312.1 ferritin-like domain protein, DpsA family [Picosynechococcus sp. PCC 7002]AMA08129.1 DNA starvation/stationary phase protection protein [Picosynechococcus sp. PCC 73109]ANV86269.1 DNA starvation/stationary phase protection protein [Picosynechococcus sp. PCC 7117]ANV89440.1 DNA starvation/stationary phase protection protein [Picosynechococcus sp. PCC 8807]QCS48945.1 DNA starvation/stationary phase prote